MANYYDEIYDIIEQLVYKLLIYDNKGFRVAGKKETLSILDMQILQKICRNKEKKIYELIKETGLERRVISSIVQKLVMYSYIQKEQSKKDKRVYILKGTESGKKATNYIFKKQNEWLEFILEDMSLNEKKVILNFLNKINQKRNTPHVLE
jgi:DNA-binding MarR family transcriptional regulator